MNKPSAALVVVSLVAALAAAPSPAAGTGWTTVFLVRHAEKESGSADPSLTAPGLKRAQRLAEVLADGGIQAVYTSQFARTRETARPLADKLGLTATVVPVEAGGVERRAAELARRILAEHAGRRVLVVGHSNTLPQLMEALGATGPILDEKKDYDDLVEVVIGPSGNAALVHLHYGELTP